MRMPFSNNCRVLKLAADGDAMAINELFGRFQAQLLLVATARLDSRLARRVDPSDVVQDSLLRALDRLDDYLKHRPLPFHAWLKQFVVDRVVEIHRLHLRSKSRSVSRETKIRLDGTDSSDIAGKQISPLQDLCCKESRNLLSQGIERLSRIDQEILELIHIRGITVREGASVLGISFESAKKRYRRAIDRLSNELKKVGSSLAQGN